MSQVLHIFRKDTRRLWLEILLSVAVTAAMLAVYPGEWQVGVATSDRMRIGQYVGVLALLLMVSWWLLLARSVQAEALVGEQQFWITRPYEWKKLLAAKVLFAAVWIAVPYMAAQLVLLHLAGFAAMDYAGGLLASLAVAAVLWLLPLFAIAAVTLNLVRLALTALGVLIALVGFQYLTSDVAHSGYVAYIPYKNVFLVPLLLAGCAAAIGLEYATRRTWVARGLLLAVPVLMAASTYAYRRPSLVDRAYPQTGVVPVSIRMDKQPPSARSFAGGIYVDLPLDYAGVAEGTAVFGDDFKFTVVAADGSQWTSPWQSIEHRYIPGTGEQHEGMNLMMRPGAYERFKQGPVTLRMTFALSRYQADAVRTTAYPATEAAIPGIGFCVPQNRRGESLYCRAPLGGPQLTRVTINWSWVPCDDPQPMGDAVKHGDMWLEQAGPSFFSVWNSDLWFGGDQGDLVRGQQKIHVCPGSPLTVTHYHLIDRMQEEVTFQNVVLPERVDPT